MNPPLNCGAKIATKIESANFSVKKVHFSAKTARQGAFGAPERASFHCPIGRRRTPQGTAGRRGWTSAGGQPADGQALGCSLSPDPAERHRAPPGTGAPRPHPATGAHRSAPQTPPLPPPGAETRLLPLPHRPCDGPRHPPAGAAIPRPALALSTELSYL